jgi:hypothetical protein
MTSIALTDASCRFSGLCAEAKYGQILVDKRVAFAVEETTALEESPERVNKARGGFQRAGTRHRRCREVSAHTCKLGCEGIVSKRRGSLYRSGRSRHWLKVKNPVAPAVPREAEEEWR